MSEPHLEDLPEALPLHRVAPAWRALALIAFLLTGLMVLLVFVLGTVIAGLHAQLDVANATVAPVAIPAVITATAMPTQPEADPEVVEEVNLPYPVREDLTMAARRVQPDPEETVTARDRFLKKGKEVWKCPQSHQLSQVVLSPDGQQIAYLQFGNLVAGPLGAPQVVGTAPMTGNPGGFPTPAVSGETTAPKDSRSPVGHPVWSADSRYVYYSDADSRLLRYDSSSATFEVLPFRGQSPAPGPGNSWIIFVRAHPIAKVETPGAPAAADPTEIVMANLTNRKMQIVVPQARAAWSGLVVSPDGKRLAAISDRGHEGSDSIRWRIFVGDLSKGKMTAVTPPAAQVSPPCWTTDGKQLIYARSQLPTPTDCWANPEEFSRSTDLFQYDLEAKRETRLSRGGGFLSPSLGLDGSLYYLTASRDSNFRIRPRIFKMTLAGAQQFGRTERELPVRDAAVWTALLERVCKAADVPANVGEIVLSPELLRRIAEQFDLAYKELFQEVPPATETALGRLLLQELPAISWGQADEPRSRLMLVLGAVQGEFLRRKGGAEWSIVPGPFTRVDKPGADDHSAFGFVFNPFLLPMYDLSQVPAGPDRGVEHEGGFHGVGLNFLQYRSEGRPVLLTNDPASARAALSKQVDPDLKRGTELLKQNQADEAEKVLLELANRPANQSNRYLALQIGRLLYDHDRKDALRKLMEQRCAKPPRDARQFNLLGLALLDAEPEKAVGMFKKALRCDLHFGPAYLNLAQAYQKVGENRSARMCLKRYRDLMPQGPLAADAARRMAALEGR